MRPSLQHQWKVRDHRANVGGPFRQPPAPSENGALPPPQMDTDVPRVLEETLDEMRRVLNGRTMATRTIQTTDAVATEIWSDFMPQDSAWSVKYDLLAINTATGDAAFYNHLARYKRVGSATPTIVSFVIVSPDDEDVAAWTPSTTTSADGKVQIDVTGTASTTINWRIHVLVNEIR